MRYYHIPFNFTTVADLRCLHDKMEFYFIS
jgi:hypothetical protein